MPLQDKKQITADEMLVEWGVAEIPERWRDRAPEHLVQRVEAGGPLDHATKAEVAAFMLEARGEVRSLLNEGAKWYKGRFPVAALGDLLLDGYFIFTPLGFGVEEPWPEPHPRTLAELVLHPSAPALTIKGEFKLEAIRGRPIFIGTSFNAPFHLIEGSNRTRAVWLANERLAGEAIEAVVGVTPEPTRFKNTGMWLALARIGCRPGSGLQIVRDIDQTRRFVAACPDTGLATVIAAWEFAAMQSLFKMPAVSAMKAVPWTWT